MFVRVVIYIPWPELIVAEVFWVMWAPLYVHMFGVVAVNTVHECWNNGETLEF